MNRLSAIFWLTFTLSLPLAWPHTAHGADRQTAGGLGQAVNAALALGCVKKESSAVTIISMTTGEVVYDMNGALPLKPASVQKLLVSSAALHHLGQAYTFKTRISHTGARDSRTIHGDLYIKGYGDPKLTPEQVWIIAGAVRAMGVERVEGKLVIDSSFFDGAGKAPAWNDNRSQRAYDAGLGALSVSFNTLAIRAFPGPGLGDPMAVSIFPDPGNIKIINLGKTARSRVKVAVVRNEGNGSRQVTVSGAMAPGDEEEIIYINVESPRAQAGAVFLEYLRRAGVQISGGWDEGVEPAGAVTLYEHKSEPLALIIRGLNKYSNNFTAEQVAKTMAAELYGPPGDHETALKILTEFLRQNGAPMEGVTLADASGLSRQNRLTSAALATLLYSVGKRFDIGPELTSALSVMGVDGSLKKRGSGLPLASMARAKTGSLLGVSSLAGYAIGASNSLYSFAIIKNDSTCTAAQEDRAEDGIVAAINRYAR